MGKWPELCGSLGIGELDRGAGDWFVWALKEGLVGRSSGVVGAVWLGRGSLAPDLPALPAPGWVKQVLRGAGGRGAAGLLPPVVVEAGLASWCGSTSS